MTQLGPPGKTRSGLERRVHVSLRVLQQSEDFLLDGDLVRVRQLVSIAGKDFDAIVGPGIVRRRNHHAGGILPRVCEVGNAGSCDYARAVHFNPAGSQTLRHPICNP